MADPLGGDATAPSASPEPLPNAETWLGFTDLVFIDPTDTGYSRVLTTNDDARKVLWSVNGDIAYLAEVIRRWLDRFDRDVSPKYLLGESYGGFRAPRLARELAVGAGGGRLRPGAGVAAARCRRAEPGVRSVLFRRSAAVDGGRGARVARSRGKK